MQTGQCRWYGRGAFTFRGFVCLVSNGRTASSSAGWQYFCINGRACPLCCCCGGDQKQSGLYPNCPICGLNADCRKGSAMPEKKFGTFAHTGATLAIHLSIQLRVMLWQRSARSTCGLSSSCCNEPAARSTDHPRAAGQLVTQLPAEIERLHLFWLARLWLKLVLIAVYMRLTMTGGSATPFPLAKLT